MLDHRSTHSIARRIAVPVLALSAFGLAAGCVPQDRYDQLLTAHRSLEEQLNRAEGELETERANVQAMRDQVSRATEQLVQLQNENERMHADLSKVSEDYDALLRRVSELEIGPLPVEVEDAIHALAAAYPNVLSFDARRGLLAFASDFTFDLGSVSLTSEAQRTLAELAKILNEANAMGFEARIVGHTDNVRIARPETLRNHPTNLHLSVHRAISVAQTLANEGVGRERMQVAGYGPYRPRVAHRQGGTPENRRVEIFLVPMPAGVAPAEADQPAQANAPAPAPSRAAQTRVNDEPMK